MPQRGERASLMRYGQMCFSCRRSFAVPLAVLLGACSLTGCSSSPSMPPAGRVGINTAAGWSDSPFISGDGRRLYFMYSRYDFAPFILTGGTQAPVLAGPDRPGLHHSSQPFDESDIYMATRAAAGSWSEPVNLGLNGSYGDASGMEIDGGRTFVWLQGNGTTNKLVMATKAATSGPRRAPRARGLTRSTWGRPSTPRATRTNSGSPPARSMSIGMAPRASCTASPMVRPARRSLTS